MTIRSGRSLTVAAQPPRRSERWQRQRSQRSVAAPASQRPRSRSVPPPPRPGRRRPVLGAARLVGTFELAGRITTAVRVTGEHKGQNVTRTWSFLPGCSIGACRTIELLRERSGGSDKVKLTRKRPGYYVGSGSFYAPLQCGGKTYRRGEAVPFTVTVTITSALRDPTGALVATAGQRDLHQQVPAQPDAVRRLPRPRRRHLPRPRPARPSSGGTGGPASPTARSELAPDRLREVEEVVGVDTSCGSAAAACSYCRSTPAASA